MQHTNKKLDWLHLVNLYYLGRLPRSKAFEAGGGGSDGFCKISIILLQLFPGK
jgi:hypothetical protein